MKLATKQGVGLCMVIGMMLSGIPPVLAQDIAKVSPSSPHKSYHTEVKALAIGDQVPDLEFQNVLNYKSKTAKLSDFKGKLVILDMWSTICTSCIAAFPKMEKLQKEFSDKIQILLVNPHTSSFDSKERIKVVLSNLKNRTGFYPSLPIAIHDSILNSYFPHESVPHEIWINSNGEVIAITGAIDVTEENIKAVLERKKEQMPIKNDWAYDYQKPLLFDSNGGDPNTFLYRSLFTKYIGGIGFGSGFRKNDKNEIIGLYILNTPLINLICQSYPELLNNKTKCRVFFESNNPAKFKYDLEPTNLYCYDLIIPPTPEKSFDMKRFIREDLNRYFNITVRPEKRKMLCWKIELSDKIQSLNTRYSNSEIDLDDNAIKKYLHNYSIEKALWLLETKVNIPILLGSQTSLNIDFDFPERFNISDSDQVKTFLEKNGFIVKAEEEIIDAVIISDK